jgi:hypothetical protein
VIVDALAPARTFTPIFPEAAKLFNVGVPNLLKEVEATATKRTGVSALLAQFKNSGRLIVEDIQVGKDALAFCLSNLFNRGSDDPFKREVDGIEAATSREKQQMDSCVSRLQLPPHGFGNAPSPSVDVRLWRARPWLCDKSARK